MKNHVQSDHMICVSVPEDFNAWLSLAGEVEHLFGPMCHVPDFHSALQAAIVESRAL